MIQKALFLISKTLKKIIKTKSNRIIFRSMNSTNYNCNPKYISEYLSNNYGNEFDIIWVLSDLKKYSFLKKKNIKLTSSHSLKTFYYYMSSKFIVDNNGVPKYISYKDEQIIINTWHGGGSYKKREDNVKKKDAIEIYTKYLSSCRSFSVNNLLDFYENLNENVVFESGSPRNDIFFNKSKMQVAKAKVKNYFNISDDTKVILYAPTYKENEKNSNTFLLPIKEIINACEKKFGAKFVFAIRDHKYSQMNYNFDTSISTINTDSYDDLQEIICASDIVITDYSSIMWDVSFTNSPCFIYADDIEEYISSRNFYTPIDEWPFPIAKNDKELVQNILNYDEATYKLNVEKHHKKLGSFENGTACKQVCDYIINSK